MPGVPDQAADQGEEAGVDEVLKLSEIFSIPDADPSLELKAVMLNINKSSSIRAKSSARYQYQSFSLFLCIHGRRATATEAEKDAL